MKERGVPFKQALNDAVRTGLLAKQNRRPFVQKTYPMGSERNFRWDKALAIAAAMEDEELIRKMTLRK